MDKKVIFAVAGSGKTTLIAHSLTLDKRVLIVTYTNSNYNNLEKKILEKFHGTWPENVTLMKFFQFLYRFCYKPFLADKFQAKGIIFEPNKNKAIKQDNYAYYLNESGYFYSNRISLFLNTAGVIEDIKERIESYFDEFVIDEVQDIAGRDFTFLEQIMETRVSMMFVGDFFQHTFDTSRDGNANNNLFDNQTNYMKRFENKGVIPDTDTLINSYRCSKAICEYITENLGITIYSNRTDDTTIQYISDSAEIERILNNDNIMKMHFRKASKFGLGRKNWGDSKGEDCYTDVCVMLNKETMKKYNTGKLSELAPSTRNKLYVAITRAHGNVYLINENYRT